jgi:hypothetical protein
MNYVCKRKNALAVLLSATLVTVILVFIFLAAFGIWIRGIWETAAMILAVAAIQISQKHIFSYFEFIIDPHDEIIYRNRITVVRIAGRNRTSVFTLSLKNLCAVVPYKDRKKLKEEYGTPKSRYSYCMDILPKESYILVFENNGEAVFVRIECDKDFVSEIEKRMGV